MHLRKDTRPPFGRAILDDVMSQSDLTTIAIAIAKALPFEIRPSKSPDFKCFQILNGQISVPPL